MSNQLSNEHLSKKINQLTHHLPAIEELNGQRQGCSYYRKTNPQTFLKSFEKTHHKLDYLKKDYHLTSEQEGFITQAQAQLVSEIEQAFASHDEQPNCIKDFLDKI